MKSESAWIRAADRMVAVAALFCVVVFALLLGNMARGRAVDPIKPAVLEKRLLALNREPKNEALKNEVRRLDREVRSEWFNGRAFALKGFYLLIGGIAAFLVAVETSQALRRRMPVPRPTAVRESWAAAAMSRKSVAALGTLGAGLLVVIAVVSRHDAAAEYARAADREFKQLMTQPNPAAATAARTTEGTENTEKARVGAIPVANPAASAATLKTTASTGMGVKPFPVVPVSPVVKNTSVSSVPSVVHSNPPPSARRALLGPMYAAGWEASWPRFRGPEGTGIASSVALPGVIDAAKGEGILWKADVALPGWNSPVVWGDRVFLTGADKSAREIYCYNAQTGSLEWKHAVPWPSGGPGVKVMEGTGYAPSTGATDGKRFFAAFVNGEVVCVDFAGKALWTRSLGAPENGYGHAASLAVYGNGLIVQMDQGEAKAGKSRLLALDVETGKTVWEVARPVGSSWSTPAIAKVGQKELLITTADPLVVAYDPLTGQEIWKAQCLKGEIVCSAAAGGGRVFVCTEGSALTAIGADGTVEWKYEEDLPDIASPVSDGELVYVATSNGFVAAIDAKTGKKVWERQYDGAFHASPILAGKQIVLVDSKGGLFVLEGGRQFKEVLQGKLGEDVEATPAIAGGRMFVRTAKRLLCVGAEGARR